MLEISHIEIRPTTIEILNFYDEKEIETGL